MKKITIFLFLILTSMLVSQVQASEEPNEKKKAEEKDLIVTLTSSNYEQTISKGIVFVDFWAAWCGPCRKMNPILKEVAAEREGKVIIAKLNVDEYEVLTRQQRVSNLPTIIVYKEGKELTRVSGLVPKEKLLEVVDYLSSVE